jgi:iron-sulfur cluster assembly protein
MATTDNATPAAATPAKPRPRRQLMSLTDRAADRVKALGENRPGATLKLGVKKGGCAGMEYTLEWAEARGKFDEMVEDKGATVLIDPKAVMYLIGAEMDWKTDKLASQFVFNNPNQKSACGCGESVELVPAPMVADGE